jgi:hypothetical protein
MHRECIEFDGTEGDEADRLGYLRSYWVQAALILAALSPELAFHVRLSLSFRFLVDRTIVLWDGWLGGVAPSPTCDGTVVAVRGNPSPQRPA